MTARAVYFTGPGRTELRTINLEPRPGEVLVESRLIGISHGTERNLFRGTFSSEDLSDDPLPSISSAGAYPLAYGYMNAGLVSRSAAGFEPGRKVFAFFPHQDRFSCSSDTLVPLPDELGFEDAVFLANTETALSIVHDTAPRYGERGLVIGLGVIGLLTAELLLRSGAVKLIALDPVPARRAGAESLGCVALDPSEPDTVEVIRSLTGGRGADFAVNVSANERGLKLGLDVLAFEGRLIEASWYGNRTVMLPLGGRFHRNRLTIRSSQVSHIAPGLTGGWDKERRYAVAIGLLGELRPSKYITHRFPLERAQDAFELIDRGDDELIQAVLEP